MERPTCKNCKKPLKKYTHYWTNHDKEEPEPIVGSQTAWGTVLQITRKKISTWAGSSISYWTGQWGYYGQGYFCSLKCGYYYAVKLCKDSAK